MDCEEVFGQLLRYFPESADQQLYANIRAFAQACLAAGAFGSAEKYADYLLAREQSGARQIAAYRIKLFCRLHCKSEDEFLHCPAFHKDMEEYQSLIAACADDPKSLETYIHMANANAETVAQDEARRLEQEALARQKREEEEKQRRQQRLQERALRREKRKEVKKISLCVILFNILPFCLIITGFILWGSNIDKYAKPLLVLINFCVSIFISMAGINVFPAPGNEKGTKSLGILIAFILMVFSIVMMVIAGIIFNE